MEDLFRDSDVYGSRDAEGLGKKICGNLKSHSLPPPLAQPKENLAFVRNTQPVDFIKYSWKQKAVIPK
jgi:hypothetical protein